MGGRSKYRDRCQLSTLPFYTLAPAWDSEQEMFGRFLVVLTAALAFGSGAARAERPGPGGSLQAGQIVSSVDVFEPVVALTFDDGPRDPYTAQILDVLRDQGVLATFFLIGENVERYPALAKRILREGHAIGNHSFSHRALPSLAGASVRGEIDRADRAIQTATGLRPRLFRPPYGSIDPRLRGPNGLLASRGHTVVLWSVEVNDWSTRSAQRVALRTLTRVRPGSIVLLHDGGGDRAHVVIATRWMIANLSQRGFTMVTVPDLLAMRR